MLLTHFLQPSDSRRVGSTESVRTNRESDISRKERGQLRGRVAHVPAEVGRLQSFAHWAERHGRTRESLQSFFRCLSSLRGAWSGHAQTRPSLTPGLVIFARFKCAKMNGTADVCNHCRNMLREKVALSLSAIMHLNCYLFVLGASYKVALFSKACINVYNVFVVIMNEYGHVRCLRM